jgi:tetratricopeptide (TPR) repeat protein
MIGRTGIAALAMLITMGAARPSPAIADDYAAIVRAYRDGDADAAVARLVALDRQRLETDFRLFTKWASPGLAAAAAALHTEVALRPRVAITVRMADVHLELAASIVEAGLPPTIPLLGPRMPKGSDLREMPQHFRRLWYLAVLTAMEQQGRLKVEYFERARLLFPHDAEILLLSGIAEEVFASPRLLTLSAGARRNALERAEAYLRDAIAIAPDRMEARLRLGRVLAQRGRAAEARDLLTGVTGIEDARLPYLAALFLGGLEDEAGNTAGAAQWYAKATAGIPAAQAARLASSELQHRAGERQKAIDTLDSAIGEKNVDDPWWAYVFGEYWRTDLLLDALRKMSRS